MIRYVQLKTVVAIIDNKKKRKKKKIKDLQGIKKEDDYDIVFNDKMGNKI